MEMNDKTSLENMLKGLEPMAQYFAREIHKKYPERFEKFVYLIKQCDEHTKESFAYSLALLKVLDDLNLQYTLIKSDSELRMTLLDKDEIAKERYNYHLDF
ncbi:MAG: hypothetical protein PWP03_559 [Candidatus Woesearchaeota archaeon]|nr:hypothetical protein [Candidatus Woesearchaeota archaeon]